jgi:hypothetical protein
VPRVLATWALGGWPAGWLSLARNVGWPVPRPTFSTMIGQILMQDSSRSGNSPLLDRGTAQTTTQDSRELPIRTSKSSHSSPGQQGHGRDQRAEHTPLAEESARWWRKRLLPRRTGLLKAIMNTAVDDGLIRRNPAGSRALRKTDRRNGRYFPCSRYLPSLRSFVPGTAHSSG